MGDMDNPVVPERTRLRLAHACLQHLAGADGATARVLHLKGESLHPLLSAGRPASTDCDLLVHPDDLAAFERALVAHGWERRTTFEQGSVFGHAAAYFHPVWGTIDLHRSFPGLDRDPRATFGALWADRVLVDLGGHACATPDLRAQRLVLLVHAARDAMGRREHDTQVAWTDAHEAERDAVDALAERLGAQVPLALVTSRPERAAGLPGEHVWAAVHADANPTEVWRARLRDARGVGVLRVLLEATRVNRDHLELRLGHAPSRAELRAEWWDRLRRGLPRLVRRRRRGSDRTDVTPGAAPSDGPGADGATGR